MKKALAIALTMTGLAGSAYAADWTPPKVPDPIPENLTFWGITPIGVLDLGGAYQTNGRPLGAVVSALEYSPFTTTRNYTGQSIATVQHSALQQSFIGVKVEEPLGGEWKAIARLDTGVDPLRGTLSDGCSSFLQNAGIAYNQQTSNADSGRCGQAFNGQLWGGIRNQQYGQLTIGRNNSFQLDGIAMYDPMALSYALSLLGYSGTNGGAGSTEAARWDNSVKYVYDNGPIIAGIMYSSGGNATGFFGDAYAFVLGGHIGGFSAEATYTKEHGAVNLQSAANLPLNSTSLFANMSDDQEISVMGKYTWEFGRPGGAAYSGYTKAVKAEPMPVDKFTIFAGYSNVRNANPTTPITQGDAAGGYLLTTLDNNAFTTARVFNFYWAGAKYDFAWGLSLTGAYYHVNQNSYVADNNPCPATGGASAITCAGGYDQVSLLADYALNKHLDVYAGATWAQVSGGLAAAFPGNPGTKVLQGINFSGPAPGHDISTAAVVTGFRIKL
ncbi:MAG TPA: porin [Bradyrhizobium sp.]|uniref:porin n=1 Tax=Bradyrhizobium sp. TaxID=376 RepID=UPI002D7F7337|nr:porin [Bradyrhizobium sp.]HET7886119.1 porin [Bradyrhizobium sp.]